MSGVDIPALLEQRAVLKTQKDKITDAINVIEAVIKDANPAPGRYGEFTISWRKAPVSWWRVQAEFPQTEFPQLYTGFNKTVAEKQIAPAILDQYRSEQILTIR